MLVASHETFDVNFVCREQILSVAAMTFGVINFALSDRYRQQSMGDLLHRARLPTSGQSGEVVDLIF
jgi:hypothetical protein